MTHAPSYFVKTGGWMRIWSIASSLLAVGFCLAAAPVSGVETSRQAISLEKALQIAAGAIGHPAGLPDSYEVVTAKLFFSKLQKVTNEWIPESGKSSLSLLSDKQYWLIQYRRWPIRMDGALSVFVDANSGDVLVVARDLD